MDPVRDAVEACSTRGGFRYHLVDVICKRQQGVQDNAQVVSGLTPPHVDVMCTKLQLGRDVFCPWGRSGVA